MLKRWNFLKTGFYEGIKIARCSNVQCGEGITKTVDKEGSVGNFASITIGEDGLPLISYFDASSTGALKVTHCSKPSC